MMMQNRLRHLEEMVHNGEVAARQTLLSDPDQLAHATEAARCVASSFQYTQYWRDADESEAYTVMACSSRQQALESSYGMEYLGSTMCIAAQFNGLPCASHLYFCLSCWRTPGTHQPMSRCNTCIIGSFIMDLFLAEGGWQCPCKICLAASSKVVCGCKGRTHGRFGLFDRSWDIPVQAIGSQGSRRGNKVAGGIEIRL